MGHNHYTNPDHFTNPDHYTNAKSNTLEGECKYHVVMRDYKLSSLTVGLTDNSFLVFIFVYKV